MMKGEFENGLRTLVGLAGVVDGEHAAAVAAAWNSVDVAHPYSILDLFRMGKK